MKRVELARELQCSPATITGLITKKGMPIEVDGNLDRDKCLHWILKSTSGKDGGWNAEQRGASLRDRAEAFLRGAVRPARREKLTAELRQSQKRAAKKPAVSEDTLLGRRAGIAWTAHHLCSSVNTILPGVLQGMQFDDVPVQDQIIVAKLTILALVSHLMTAWCEEPLKDAAQLGLSAVQEIPYETVFGADAEEARGFVEEMRAYWAGGSAA
jgi:hypothetical protein